MTKDPNEQWTIDESFDPLESLDGNISPLDGDIGSLTHP